VLEPTNRSSKFASSRRRRLQIGTVAVSAAGLLALGGVALAENDAVSSFWFTPDRPVVAAVQEDQTTAFAVLDRGRRAGDAPSAAVRDQLGGGSFGRNLELSRAIDTPSGKGWVVPGNGVICLVIPDPIDGFGATCNDTQTARRTGLLGMLSGPSTNGRVQVTLVTPKGSSARDASGRSLPIDADGILKATAGHGSHIDLRTDAGVHRIEMPLPPPDPRSGRTVDQVQP
jgi:hypothetical protein